MPLYTNIIHIGNKSSPAKCPIFLQGHGAVWAALNTYIFHISIDFQSWLFPFHFNLSFTLYLWPIADITFLPNTASNSHNLKTDITVCSETATTKLQRNLNICPEVWNTSLVNFCKAHIQMKMKCERLYFQLFFLHLWNVQSLFNVGSMELRHIYEIM